ncbi:MAG TPA: hypothetical protein VMB81_26370 [Candidatus Sulfotelmatobacter sp.]|nr:hypothetical protein [Candidatus Sulfotelmatobacter sp.]
MDQAIIERARATRRQTLDLAILLEATAAVVGEVSKVFQALRRAVDTGDVADYRRALAAFDGLPAWQRARIFSVATTRAVEVAKPEDGLVGVS